MADLELASLDTLLAKSRIASTEDLTRTLRAAAQPLQQRLALAWAVFDGSGIGENSGGGIRRLSTILVRKDELLGDWVFSMMHQELKTAKPGKYSLYRDPAAISLLVSVLKTIRMGQASDDTLDTHTVLQGRPMPLFVRAFADKLEAKDARYVVELTQLWRFVIESTTDGLEAVSSQPDQLVQLLESLGDAYLEASTEPESPLERALRGMVAATAHAMRSACEASMNARKMFALFDKRLLLQYMRVGEAAGHHGDVRERVYDMLHAGLFHAECMGRFISVLTDRPTSLAEGEQSYVAPFFDIITDAMADTELRVGYAAALPSLLERYLQAAALVCSETRSMAATTLGLSAVAANPLGVTQAETGASCLAMYTYMHKQLAPLKSDERVLAAINRLASVYFGDSCFGTTGSSGILSSEMHQKQGEALDAWLETAVRPILADRRASAAAQRLALDGVKLALDAGPDAVQVHGEQVLDALSRVPTENAGRAAAVLEHVVATFRKARRLALLVCNIARIGGDHQAETHTNLLVDAGFLRTLRQAVSQAMPFAQVSECIAALADAIAGPAKTDEEHSPKRRRVAHVAGEMQTVVMANFVLASVGTVGTEQQSVQFGRQLSDTYTRLMRALVANERAWERQLVHYAFMEAGARLNGTERWLEVCMDPERVRAHVLASEQADARAAALGMAVAFQTAAHWTVLEASIAAGVVSTQTDADAGARATRAMVSAQFPAACLALPTGAVSDGWQDWDGQPHTISADNCRRAQWALLLDWLELACEHADAAAMHQIALRLVAGLAQAPVDERGDAHELLGTASFFEIAAVRTALVPALAEYALQLWRAQSSDWAKPSKLMRRLDTALEHLAAPEIGKLLGTASSKTKHGLSRAQAAAWVQLARSLLRFPDAYWGADRIARVFALVLAIDTGVAAACADTTDANALRLLACALADRLLRRAPNIVSGLLEFVKDLVDHWTALAEEATGELATYAHRLACLAVAALAQAGFGQANKAADTACRELCTGLFARLDSALGVLALDALAAVAQAARQYAASLKSCPGIEQWTALLPGWIGQTAQAVARGGERAACFVGAYAVLRRLAASMGCDGSGDDEIAGCAATQLGEGARESSGLRLALAVYAVYTPQVLGASASRVLALLVRQLASGTAESSAARQQRELRAAIAAITGASVDEEQALSDVVGSYAVEPLLQGLDEAAFVAALTAFVQGMLRGGQAAAIGGSAVRVCVRLARKQDTGAHAAQRQRAVQRRVGSVLTATHAAISRADSAEAAADALRIVDEVVGAPGLRCTMHDIGEALASVWTLLMAPLRQAPDSLADLYCQVCRCLGAIARRHGAPVLDAPAALVPILRVLQHAFVSRPDSAPALPNEPWLVAHAPFPVRCAEAYSRLLSDLCQARRPDASKRSDGGELVKLTRGTGASGTAAVLTAYVPQVLAEFCVIQAGGASTLVARLPVAARATGTQSFRGLSWRPATPTAAGRTAIVASPAVRDALLPGWYALFDCMTADDRHTLLAMLATQPAADPSAQQHRAVASWPALFAPEHCDGAHEVLKSLYQSYSDHYKYTGQV
ncbi:hypothetical protein IWW51_001727 [Coemansia sp. RSA 2702]|nr:hypothetical protein IWW51_001727 [Coemansia sp. RSA 2702]